MAEQDVLAAVAGSGRLEVVGEQTVDQLSRAGPVVALDQVVRPLLDRSQAFETATAHSLTARTT